MSIDVSSIMSNINQKLLSHHIEIKPCPFCGSDRIYVGIASADGYHVKCVKCGCRTPEVYPESLDDSDDGFNQPTSYEEYEAQLGLRSCQKALSIWNRRYDLEAKK